MRVTARPRVEGVAPLGGFSVAGHQYSTVLRTHNGMGIV